MAGKGLVIVGTLGAGVVTAVGQVGQTGRLPSTRIAVGSFSAAVLLALLAEAAPDLAGALAAMILVSSIFVFGAPAFATLSHITAPAPTGEPR